MEAVLKRFIKISFKNQIIIIILNTLDSILLNRGGQKQMDITDKNVKNVIVS